jgi:hypothetical protein
MAFSLYRRPVSERRKIMSFSSRLRERMTGHSRYRRTRRREPLSPFYAQAAQVETLEQRCLLSGFSPGATYAIGTNPRAVVTADVNGDGKLDLIVSNAGTSAGGGGISVLLAVAGKNGAATGTFAPPQNYAIGLTAAIAVGDLNGDHKLDIVTGDGRVLLNNGNGTFRIGPSYAGGLAFGDFAATADLNHDGKLDLITSGFGYVEVLLGKGDGTFSTGSTVATASDHMVVDDFNHDSNLDIVTISGTAAYLLPGNGDGTFGSAQAIATFQNADSILAMTTADFNADGKLDLAVTYSVASAGGGPATPVAILLGNGDGTFHNGLGGSFGVNPGLGAQELAAADINHDGKLDLVTVGNLVSVGTISGATISVLYGNGDGSFTTGQNFVAFPGSVSNPTPFAVGDFNGDGYPDIALAGINNSSLEIFLWNPKRK